MMTRVRDITIPGAILRQATLRAFATDRPVEIHQLRLSSAVRGRERETDPAPWIWVLSPPAAGLRPETCIATIHP